jgi:hypothetical protein
MVTGVDGAQYAFCKACNIATKLVTFREYDSDRNVRKVTYRCAQMIAGRSKKMPKMPHLVHERHLWSYDSLGDDIQGWDEAQDGCCLMCGKRLRLNPHTNSRALFVVPLTSSEVMKGLYCWDCRTLLTEFVGQRYQQLMSSLVGLGRVVVSPPQ